MLTQDLAEVLKIEQVAQVSPWARLSFEESLTKENYCRLIESKDNIVAYSVVSSVLDELHILNIVCAPKFQGLGFGHILMQDILDYAESNALKKIFLEVRASNMVAQGLYEKWGFKQIALRKKYYRVSLAGESREDAHVYMRAS